MWGLCKSEGFLSIRQVVEHLLQTQLVFPESLPALLGQAGDGVRLLAHELLLHLQVARLLQLANVRGEVAPGQAGKAHEEDEVGVLDNVKVGEHHQPGRGVDHPVDVNQRVEFFVFLIRWDHRTPFLPGAGNRAGSG
jgi:hypothetical protein